MINRKLLHSLLVSVFTLFIPISRRRISAPTNCGSPTRRSTPPRPFSGSPKSRGIFAKHGLEGELLYINSGSMNIAALVGGSVQIAGGGPVSIEARLRGIKLTILGNPLPWLASNLVVHPDIKGIPDLAGKFAGISRFGSSTDQGFRYLFRKKELNVDRDLKMLQMGGDSSRVAALESRRDSIYVPRRRGDRQRPRSWAFACSPRRSRWRFHSPGHRWSSMKAGWSRTASSPTVT